MNADHLDAGAALLAGSGCGGDECFIGDEVELLLSAVILILVASREPAGELLRHLARFYVPMRLELSSGMGIVVDADERHRLESDMGAVLIVMEAERVEATDLGMSSPERIWGQTWPGEHVLAKRRATVLSRIRSVCRRWRWQRALATRPVARTDAAGWVKMVEGPGVERLLNGRGGDAPRG